MKPTFLLTVALVFPLWVVILPKTPASAQTQPNREQVLEACAGDQIRALPMPFVDVAPDHWAYDIVLKMYYCGPVRGPLAAQELQRLQTQGSELPDANTLSSAQETVEIEGRQYRLEANISQTAITEATLSGFNHTVIRVIAEDQQAFPVSLKVDRLWLVGDDGRMWTPAIDEVKQPAHNQIEYINIDFLGWKSGTLLDVVVRLRDGENRYYFLKATEQPILPPD